ncbi:hypothetical protein NQZ68_000137 [Dissostichus eleginoides]|nr:hypothetical protein NQZ68_000137 [Dissostichus eleginoides]
MRTERERKEGDGRNQKSEVTYAVRLNRSWQCVLLFLERDAVEPWQTAAVSYPKCRGVTRSPVRCTRLCCTAESRALLLRQGKSFQLLCLTDLTRKEQRVEVPGEPGRPSNDAAHKSTPTRLE